MSAMENQTPANAIARIGFFAYGLLCYLLFLITFSYVIGFLGNFIVPKSINGGPIVPTSTAILINSLLLGLFAIQHTVMARPGFKKRWSMFMPKPIERSTFVLVTCLVLILLVWQWRPMPDVVWSVENSAGRFILFSLFAAGFALVLYSSFLIDHFDLFGMRQVFLHWKGKNYSHPGFAQPMLYRIVRNPLMLGFVIAFWSTPQMTQGHLLFAVLATGYIFMGISFEERDLLKVLGKDYQAYRKRTPMIFPLPWRGGVPLNETATSEG